MTLKAVAFYTAKYACSLPFIHKFKLAFVCTCTLLHISISIEGFGHFGGDLFPDTLL